MRYTAEHEWVQIEGDLLRVGITDFAQEQLGDVVYVDLPGPGTEVTQGQPFGEVESTKSVSDLFAPVTGAIEARNDALDERPELVNSDPYGEGWLVTIRVADGSAPGDLLDAAAYEALLPG
ncbi:MAG: glycine cleavage system protein GcvH [Nitriliruptor sp.]|nr:MAG: glycine cleavage system protein GcvH [Nitriliruptor sp.]